MTVPSAQDILVHKSSDTLELKPLYVGAFEYQKLMEKLKKDKKTHGNS